MGGFLDGMADGSRRRAAAARAREPLAALRRRCAGLPPPPPLRRGDAFDLIAEVKLRSPSAGALGAAPDDIPTRVRAYAAAGAVAVSVLTEPRRFAGSLAQLEAAAAALAGTGVPALRKDFLVDPYQLYEARAAGAGGALLIVRLLSRDALGEMLDCARQLGLFVLLETFDEADIDAACEAMETRGRDPAGPPLRSLHSKSLAPGDHGRVARATIQAAPPARRVRGGVGAPERSVESHSEGAPRRIPDAPLSRDAEAGPAPVLIGVNSRDLQTLEVVPRRLIELAGRLPPGCARVAESGLATQADVAAVARAGYDLALVGGALMRAPDPAGLLGALLAAGRRVRR